MRTRHPWLLAFAAALFACEVDAEEGDSPDPEPSPAEFCETVPLITWETFGEGFLTTHCQGCHASAALNRHDAPEVFTFDTEQDAVKWIGAILSVATGEEPTMPPQGGPSDEDRERLRIWLECFAQ